MQGGVVASIHTPALPVRGPCIRAAHCCGCPSHPLQVWALQGGPGDPATGFVPFFLDLQRQQGLNLTAVLPEFRGVGGASRLLCADGRPASLEGCPQEVRPAQLQGLSRIAVEGGGWLGGWQPAGVGQWLLPSLHPHHAWLADLRPCAAPPLPNRCLLITARSPPTAPT